MEITQLGRNGFWLGNPMSSGKSDLNQRVTKIIENLFVISGSAVQIRPWAPYIFKHLPAIALHRYGPNCAVFVHFIRVAVDT